MIKVDLDDMDPTRFDLVDMCVERGKAATEEKIPAIKQKIEELNFIIGKHL
ncbi:hypothetical protein Q428_03200 [Fervidicella metallireducens AeB]|uniref:Uncharacterized protein n=1 Tax=Fervidicella metallireducens AeB TaxID=1403537 RepID=A0A017RXH8_9CLOT|nr:hypothetical protein [Fervidicella metallireducens]EYE89296.1 hypothetical protein Q428_03200 [Fervidicella metallireducens AeB]